MSRQSNHSAEEKAKYYKWKSGHRSQRTAENERIADLVEQIHSREPDKGYRRYGMIWNGSAIHR